MNDLNYLIIIVLFVVVVLLGYELITTKKDMKILMNLKPRDLWLIKERIKLMSPRDFEAFCACLYRMLGYRAILTEATADGGKDVILEKNGEFTFIECKHWKDCYDKNINESDGQYHDIDERIGSAFAIGRPIAQKLRGAMDYGFNGKTPIKRGIIFTTTRFTMECQEYCKAMNIEMVDTDKIMEMVKEIGTTKLYSAVGITRAGEIL